MDNITFFNRITLAAFKKLYESFPRPLNLNVKELAMEIIPETAEDSERWNSLQAAEDAVDFLAAEGFLTHVGEALQDGTALQARLTLRGLAILGSTPDALENRTPLIDRIKKALAGGAKEAGSEAVKQITQQVFAAAIAALPALGGIAK
jgi:hypothetical protein